MNSEPVIFIQNDNGIACFFSHTYCVLDPVHRNKTKKLKRPKFKLRCCCAVQPVTIGVI